MGKTEGMTPEGITENDELFRLLVENMLEGIVIVDWDSTILFANKVAATLFGFDSAEELIGHKSLEFVHPDSRNLLLENLQTIRRGESKVNNEYRLRTNKGEDVWFETCGTKITFRGRSADLVTFNDITERKQAEKKLRESEEKFRLFFENEPEYCYMISPGGKILDINRSALTTLGYKKEEIVGEPVLTTIYAPSSRKKVEQLFMKWKNTGSLENEELNIITKEGRERTVLLSVDSVKVDGKILCSISVQRDITERKRAEEQIKASLKEKEALLKEIHHRVKNNMQVISSLLSLQSEHIKDKEMLGMFKESQARIKSMALVHEILYQSEDFANIYFDKYIEALAQEVFQIYGVQAERVSLKIEAEDIPLGIDTAIPCGLIINELVSNALKHAFPDGEGEIEIKFCKIDEHEAALLVKDNGIGIAEDVDFRKTESLGLQLVTLLVEEQLGGCIVLDRSGGTEFCITFKRR